MPRLSALCCALFGLMAVAPAMASDSPAGIHHLNPAGLSKPTGYTHVVEVPNTGRTLYLSGQIALDAQGKLIGAGDFAKQADQVFANIKTALEASGASFDNVVKLNMYVTDMSQLQALRTARDKYINTRHPPASTLVEVSKLAREGLLLEIEAVAVVPQ
ncbi:RidA family protein [Dyella subtropica]|uniref:RidA family protein n=1 Tax=Dyella subtropica TaxID=2992127 RepID=UPI002258F91E|nr:RidA family protein [Dyella subtropica]